jgi:hypothetical protein
VNDIFKAQNTLLQEKHGQMAQAGHDARRMEQGSIVVTQRFLLFVYTPAQRLAWFEDAKHEARNKKFETNRKF